MRWLSVIALTILFPASPLFAQRTDVFQRLKQVLGEDAARELRAKHYTVVENMLVAANPSDNESRAELLALTGAVDFLHGKMSESVNAFLESDKLRASRESDRFTLAMALIQLGRPESRQVLNSLVSQHPANPLYCYWAGRLDYDERRYDESTARLTRATQLDPSSSRAWDALGLALDMQSNVEAARQAFDKAVTLNRKQVSPSPWPLTNFGSLLLRQGQLEAAEKMLRESLTYDQRLSRTHYFLARTLDKQNRPDEAIAEYKIAVQTDLQSSDACYSLAMLYRKMHRDKEANAMFAEYRRRR